MTNATAVEPGTATWQLDPAHSSVEFSVKHMMMTTVRGRFKDVQATITAPEGHPENSQLEVVIAVASIDTGSPDRDAHLRSADFFDAERYPTITFRSKKLEGDPRPPNVPPPVGHRFRTTGDLQIRDTTIEVVLDCVFEGRGPDPWGKDRVGFTARGEIDRREWGLKWNQAIETGGVLVANKVRIDTEVQFVRQDG
jgi:polyisoprenoid-binding protein YceI